MASIPDIPVQDRITTTTVSSYDLHKILAPSIDLRPASLTLLSSTGHEISQSRFAHLFDSSEYPHPPIINTPYSAWKLFRQKVNLATNGYCAAAPSEADLERRCRPHTWDNNDGQNRRGPDGTFTVWYSLINDASGQREWTPIPSRYDWEVSLGWGWIDPHRVENADGKVSLKFFYWVFRGEETPHVDANEAVHRLGHFREVRLDQSKRR